MFLKKSIEARSGEVKKLCARSCSSRWIDSQLVDPLNTKYINFCCDTDACNSAKMKCFNFFYFFLIGASLKNIIIF